MANMSERSVQDQSASQAAVASTSGNSVTAGATTETGPTASESGESCISVNSLRHAFQKKPFVIGVAGGTASGKVGALSM